MFRAVGLLSVLYAPPGGPRPFELFARMGGEQEFYVTGGAALRERFPADKLHLARRRV